MKKPVGRVKLAELKEQGHVRLTYPPFDVLVAYDDGEVFAIEDACNHAGASLSEGWVENKCAVCPMHGYVFELRTGKLLRPRGLCSDQRAYQVAIEGEDVVVTDNVEIAIIL